MKTKREKKSILRRKENFPARKLFSTFLTFFFLFVTKIDFLCWEFLEFSSSLSAEKVLRKEMKKRKFYR
jgi:hypothetical protein